MLAARNSFTDGPYLSRGDLAMLEHVAVTVKVPRKADVWRKLSGVETEGKKCFCVPVLPAVQSGSPQPPETYKDNSQ